MLQALVTRAAARIFEFTNRGDFAQEVFRELNQFVIQEMPDMIMGVGSVVDAVTAGIYIQLGANFIVSPVLNDDMAKVCNRRKVLWSPGCGSVSEISRAEELGAEVVKIFPGAEVGGPRFVEMVKGAHAMDQHYAHGRCGRHTRKPCLMVQSRCMVCRHGIQADHQRHDQKQGF